MPDILVEIKFSSAPTLTKSMRIAADDLNPRRKVIVAPVAEPYALAGGYEVLLFALLNTLFTA